MSGLDQAIAIATKAHAGQVDKSGQPYILHPLRLMFKFHSEDEMIVAVMHDVIEDSLFTLDYLKNDGFSDVILDALECLTKRKGEKYGDFVLRILQNELAQKIKIEDIKDNLDLTRLNKITDDDLVRVEKYHRALNVLSNA
ncbi:MAG: GTP pyrophosphokinase [Gammaproteobacteria bacterium]|nr:GTP pyrophosphokinase [Gammaproteobacteria bacterium]